MGDPRGRPRSAASCTSYWPPRTIRAYSHIGSCAVSGQRLLRRRTICPGDSRTERWRIRSSTGLEANRSDARGVGAPDRQAPRGGQSAGQRTAWSLGATHSPREASGEIAGERVLAEEIVQDTMLTAGLGSNTCAFAGPPRVLRTSNIASTRPPGPSGRRLLAVQRVLQLLLGFLGEGGLEDGTAVLG
jgi:hypothetical protein